MIPKAEMQEVKAEYRIPVFECPKCGKTAYLHSFLLPGKKYILHFEECECHADEQEVVEQ